MDNLEYRFTDIKQQDNYTVSGTAMLYGSRAQVLLSNGRRYAQVLQSRAFQQDMSTVTLNLQHDRTKLLARAGANLTLKHDSRGVEFRADLSSTALGREAFEMVKAGILTGASVEMAVQSDRLTATPRTRHIQRAVLRAIGLVDTPAYKDSQIEARFDSMQAEREARGKIGRVWL